MKEESLKNVTFVDDREKLYFATARLGIQAIEFLNGPTGRYLHGRAKQQLDQCKEAGLRCNPDSFFGRRKLRKIRNKAELAEMFMSWCAEIITEGEAAEQELKDYRG